MKRLFRRSALYLFLIPAILLNTAVSQELQDQGEKHFLWKVSSAKNTVYLLGSLHVLGKDSYPLGDAYETAFQDSEIVVFEVDPGELDKPETIQFILKKAALEKGSTLKEVISPEAYEQTKKELKEMGADIGMFSLTKPWFVALTATILKLSKMGFDPEYGVDRYFYDKAIGSSKEVLGLETAQYQIELIASLGDESDDDVLLHTLKDLDVIEVELPNLVDSWKRGDSEKFQDLIFRSYVDYPDVYQKLFVVRNNNWVPHIESYLKEDKNYLVVVGAGHLVGSEGLVEILKAKGYTVEQM